MNANWKKVAPSELVINPWKDIGTNWMLVTAGTMESWNTMTAAWGNVGVLWSKNIATCYIRFSRYTFQFAEKAPYFTLSFFDDAYKETLSYCGSHSGREVDKAKETGLTPCALGEQAVSFNEARLVLVCKKIYWQDLNPAHFLDLSIHNAYSQHDYHRFYIGEIEEAYSL